MDIFKLDPGSQLDGDSQIVRRVPEDAGVRFVVVEGQVLDPPRASDGLCHRRFGRADTDHRESAVAPELIPLAAERLPNMLDCGANVS